jgi:abnormal spindle-like microcephaly-associated protein
MSGILNEVFTPCPSKSQSSGWSEHGTTESFDSLVDDDSALDATAQIEFTTNVQVPTLTGVRPRRAGRVGNSVQIYEDISDKKSSLAEKRKRPNTGPRNPSDRKSSLLAQPAQRFRPKVNFAPSPLPRQERPETETHDKTQSLQPRANDRSLSVSRTTGNILKDRNHDNELNKNVRHSTEYTPPFMGLFSPLKVPPRNTMPKVVEDIQINTPEAQIAKRQARKSVVVHARRGPLQPSTKIAQEAAFRVDVAGKNGGKENIPPGTVLEINKKSKLDHAVQSRPKRLSTVKSKPAPCTTKHQLAKAHATDSVMGVTKQLSKQNVLGEKQDNAHALSGSLPHGTKIRAESQDPLRNASASLKARASVLSERLGQSQSMRDSKIGKSTSKELNNQYPLLTENISKPALYEDDWLSHQETVITQLINALFECNNRECTVADQNEVRLKILELYHTKYFTQLYQRLQASLSYGALTIPKDINGRNSRLKHDVGLRRTFLDTWIQSYDLRALVPALETVVGRRVFSDSTLSNVQSDTTFTNDFKAQKAVAQMVRDFLEAFLLWNDDIMHHEPGLSDVPREMHERAYRRTVLRSIILVVLLDHARQSFGTGLPRRLFLPSSRYKSSAEVLQALARLLLPSGGDITKKLSHLGCQVTYKQHPLQEYDYAIDNIAVDLRDGIRLARIVEILFYTSEHVRTGLDDQNEITLSSGEALSLLGDDMDLPLSKHLRYPCVSRAAKIYNVQISLSALSSMKGGHTIIGDARADEIVDGYREKTLGFLWTLVSKWGLDGLVDWEDVRKEIKRLQRKATLHLGYDQPKQEIGSTHKELINNDHASLLRQWATILAALKGLDIHNMTTSFADGKIYGSIVDEYKPFITGRGTEDCAVANSRFVSMSLESRLRLLGCSSQFGK